MACLVRCATSASARADGKSLNIQVSVVGRARRLAPSVEEQLLRIGQEAMTNAVRHAMAGNIDLVLEYRGDTITLRVSDDGVRLRRRTTFAGRRLALGADEHDGTGQEARDPPGAPQSAGAGNRRRGHRVHGGGVL
jgi:signal transduction histidine kinase